MRIVCMHREVVYAYGCVCVWVCMHRGAVCMHVCELCIRLHCCQASQKSLGLALLLLLEWTPVDPLCCCGRDC